MFSCRGIGDLHEGFGARGYAAAGRWILTEGALDRFAESIFKMATAFLLKWLFCQSLYFCIFPAIFGNGKTVGKLLFRLSLLDAASLEEMSPSRFGSAGICGKNAVRDSLGTSGIVSLFMLLLSKDGKSLRDRLAGTVCGAGYQLFGVIMDRIMWKLPKAWLEAVAFANCQFSLDFRRFQPKIYGFPDGGETYTYRKTARLPGCCRSIPAYFRIINA